MYFFGLLRQLIVVTRKQQHLKWNVFQWNAVNKQFNYEKWSK